MLSRLPRWLIITLISLVVAVVIGGSILMVVLGSGWVAWAGWVIIGIIVLAVILFSIYGLPQLIKLYRFQKYYKANEANIKNLGNMVQSGRAAGALQQFDGVMKHAPDSAYMLYMHALLLQSAGKHIEALSAANKAIDLISKDPMLPAQLKEMAGQMGQPTTVEEFRQQVEDLRRSLEPRVSQMRERHQKAVSKRKKKSR